MIETFWRNEQFVRAALLGAPHVKARHWPYAWLYVTYIHNRCPHKYHGQGTTEDSGVLKPSPLEIATGVKQNVHTSKLLGFGTPVDVHITVDSPQRQQKGANRKLLPRGWTGYFLTFDIDQNYKSVILRADNGEIDTGGTYKPVYDILQTGKIISNSTLESNLDQQLNSPLAPTGGVTEEELTRKVKPNFHATKISAVNQYYDQENHETIGVVLACTQTTSSSKTEDQWVSVHDFLKKNTSRIRTHKEMLLNFLKSHFRFNSNKCYPLFVLSDIKFKHKKHGDVLYQGLVIRTDAYSEKGYQVALFEDNNPTICDFHDCPKVDIVEFEVARLNTIVSFSSLKRIKNWFGQGQDRLCAKLIQRKAPVLTKRQKTFQNDPTTPQSYPHSQTFPDKDLWNEATRAEVEGLYRTKGCLKPITPVQIKDDTRYAQVKIIPSVMVYKRKVNSDGSFKKCKARLCAGGHKQVAGDGTFEDSTFAPTAGLTSIRLCLTLAVNMGLKPYQLDVEQAFLNNELDHVMIMELPAGIELQGCRHVELLKGVYGLKQAPALWYKHCYDAITKASNGLLKRSRADPCLFHYLGKDFTVLLTITVDDFAIFTDNKEWLEEFKSQFNSIYAITQEPDFSWFLGIRLQWNSDYTHVKLDQPNDVRKALIRFNMQDAKPASTPMSPDFDTIAVPEDHVNPDFPYSALIGVLLWITRMTRPDIQVAVTLLASHMSKFNEYHIKAAKRVLAYLKGTTELGIHIKKTSEKINLQQCELEIYSDSDWARDKLKRRSVTGYVGYLFGSPIVYRVCYQPTIALSSCEAEYMAMTDAAKEVLFFKNLFDEMSPDANLKYPVVLHVDNSAALSLSTTLVTNKRTKHIDIRFHFLRELHERGIILPTKVHTDLNKSDLLTKPGEENMFLRHRPSFVYDE